MKLLEEHFKPFRENTIGWDTTFDSPYGKKKIVYADWIASGRLYKPIEKKMISGFGPLVGNTHSQSSVTGTSMTIAYHHAHEMIKKHVNAGAEDVIITAGSGMTDVINKFQRILGLRIPEQLQNYVRLPEELRPVVFVTHMEHHSNHTSWLETIAEVVCISPDDEGLVDLNDFSRLLEKHKKRKIKIGAFTACSNVTGIEVPYHKMAAMMHAYGGLCFIDFACSAPYVKINMHPEESGEKLDAITFSTHKFLGGPGTPGVLIFDSKLYKNRIPDNPGGGTVDWTNPWGQHKFISDIEAREDGGTPAFLQSIKAALCIRLKEKMGYDRIKEKEEKLVSIAFKELKKVNKLHLLAGNIDKRLGAISFYIENIHYNLAVKILNDRFGIQVRGGCSCAGTYGHYLLHVDPTRSKRITDLIDKGDLSEKPGWIRLSLHPTMTNEEVYFITNAIQEIINNIEVWGRDYFYDSHKNEYFHKHSGDTDRRLISNMFDL